MEFDFLKPVKQSLLEDIQALHAASLFNTIEIHSKKEGFPDLEGVKIALFGVMENRRDINENTGNFHFDEIRKALYSLFPGNWRLKIADLGDIPAGATVGDTYFAVQSLVSELLSKKIIPIILGGSQDLTFPQYRAYDDHGKMVNLVGIDSKFDLGNADEALSNTSYVGKMVMEQPYNLFNYSNIGYQTYLNPQEEIELMESLFFDALRLGEVTAQIDRVEPVFRDADLVSLDIFSVSAQVLVETNGFSPNGFNGQQICSLARYAGISDKVSSFGLYELQNMESKTAAMLVGHIIWYFIEGVNFRKQEHTISAKNKFIKHQVPVDGEILVFYKSSFSGRWWIEIPFLPNVNNKLKKHTLLPCNHQDYLDACNQEIPDRWFKARRKNEL